MEPYLPSNGTEGMIFTAMWCDRCSRRALDPEAKTQCIHEMRALMGEDNGKWFSADGSPFCTAFRDRRLKKQTQKKADKQQMEMF